MCGIIGMLGAAGRDAAPILLEGLRRLEYRGYDSAGIATLLDGGISRRRAEGKVDNLSALMARHPLQGRTGVAHTRWATHGAPSERNAHPVANDRVAVVHNGIIENYRELREVLERDGERFETDTDTEVVAVLLGRCLCAGLSPAEAVPATLGRLRGAFALAMVFAGWEDLLACARSGPSLAIGHGESELYVSSDAVALGALTRRITYLQDGDWALLTSAGVLIRDAEGNPARRPEVEIGPVEAATGKDGHTHYMLKEICEQPAVIGRTIAALADRTGRARLPRLPVDPGAVGRIAIVACGTSSHAGLVAKYWFERMAGVPTSIEAASEFRYRDPAIGRDCLVIGISQSGETADTLAALRHAKARGCPTLGVVNQTESAIAREADAVLPTLAGPEISVASTKAFTAQLAVLGCMAVAVAEARGRLAPEAALSLMRGFADVPAAIEEVIAAGSQIRSVARQVAEAREVMFLGRGVFWPLALEGALKLKEISYIHAEGHAAGELKHGPLALVDGRVLVVALAPVNPLFEKTIGNLQEVAARGGRIVLVSSHAGIARAPDLAAATIALPECSHLAAPLLYAVPLQLLAYYAALARGTDVDRPRNLAKSVTVE